MNFRTPLTIDKSVLDINYQSPILGLGSCFAENIGHRLQQYKFPSHLNPFGIVYNPISIQHSLHRLINGQYYTAEDLISNQGVFYSFDHHGQFSHTNPTAALDLINQSLQAGSDFLKTAKYLIITLGTANVFIQRSTGEVVANCHKLPTQEFEKKRLKPQQIQTALANSLTQVLSINPSIQVILTVSPIRHIRDGLIESQRSKASLLLAVEQLVEELPFVSYFPAYELMMDDLRDYRFYEKDMIHPNQIAIDYIWESFQHTYFSEKTLQILTQVKKVVQASQHRPFHPALPAHQTFLKNQLLHIERLKTSYPYLDFHEEIASFKRQVQ